MRRLLTELRVKLGAYDCSLFVDDGEYTFECPRCSTGKRKLGVNLKKGVFNCFRCHWGGRLKELLDALSISWSGEKFDGSRPAPAGNQKLTDRVIPRVYPLLSEAKSTVERDALDFCRVRGELSPQDVEGLGLHLSTDRNLAGRLIIPIHQDGYLQNYLARAIYRWMEPKEKSGAERDGWAPRGGLAYGLDHVHPGGLVVLVEGFWDYLRVRAVSPSWNVVSILGSHLTPELAGRLIGKNPSVITIFLDGDEAGELGTRQIVKVLQARRFPDVRVARPPKGKDPDEMTDREIQNAVTFAALAPVWLLNRKPTRNIDSLRYPWEEWEQ